jgi:hypothetical protein
MKTNLLLVASVSILTGMSLKAQITLPKVWNFANDSVTWPTNPTGFPGAITTIDGLTFQFQQDGISSGSNFGTIAYKPRTYNGVTYNRCLHLGGDSYWSAEIPANPRPNQRYMHFDVPGSCVIKILVSSSSNASAGPKVIVTDGNGGIFLDSITGPTSTASVVEGSVTYRGGATTLYICSKVGTRPDFLSIKVEPYISSQNYQWNFGLDTETFAVTAGHAVDTTIANLGIHPGVTANTGEVTALSQNFNGVNYTQAFSLNGAGLWGGDFDTGETSGTPVRMMPRQRYMSFNVSGNVIITARIMPKYNATGRIFVTDGENLTGTMTTSSSNSMATEQTVNYTGGEDRTIYMFGDGAIYFFLLKVEPLLNTGAEKITVDSGAAILSVSYSDIAGRPATSATKGFLLRTTTYEDGKVITEKIVIR